MLDSEKITQRVNRQLDRIGIDSKVNGEDSHTAELVRLIVREIVRAIKTDAVVKTFVNTAGTPTQHTGTGEGKIS